MNIVSKMAFLILLAVLASISFGSQLDIKGATDDGNLPRPIAYFVVTPDVNIITRILVGIRLGSWRKRYTKLGYRLVELDGGATEVKDAILAPNPRKVLVHVGHASAQPNNPNICNTPTLAGMTAIQWRSQITLAVRRDLIYKGEHPGEANRKAMEASCNFGFDEVVNFSCWSLGDNSIAEQFVRQGGDYWGSRLKWKPTPTTDERGQVTLERYRVTGEALALAELKDLMAHQPSKHNKAEWCDWYDNVASVQYRANGCEWKSKVWNPKKGYHTNFCIDHGIEAAHHQIDRRNQPGAAYGAGGTIQPCRKPYNTELRGR